MSEIKLSSFAKINLSIDVGDTLDNGMHPVDMIMQQISFHDDVSIGYTKDPKKSPGQIDIKVSTNRYYLPVDERNLSYKAVALMIEEYGKHIAGGAVEVSILKRIPVAAGLAGGSGNGAAVLHGLNVLWRLDLDLKTLCNLGAKLGSDVPFCVMGQAGCNFMLPKKMRKDALAVPCARARGTGTELEPLKGIRKSLVIAKPPMGVSTREVYSKIDDCTIEKRPDNDELIRGIQTGNLELTYAHFINVLEAYTLNAYPQVKALKDLLEKDKSTEKVLMSGSGPTVFAIYSNLHDAKAGCEMLRGEGYEAYWTKTTK